MFDFYDNSGAVMRSMDLDLNPKAKRKFHNVNNIHRLLKTINFLDPVPK